MKRARKTTELALPPKAVDSVIGWMVAGHSEADIVEAIATNFPSQEHRPLIVEAVRQLRKSGSQDFDAIDLARGWCMEATRELYRRAVEANDTTAALACVKQIASLMKL